MGSVDLGVTVKEVLETINDKADSSDVVTSVNGSKGAVTISNATTSAAGLMSASDKTKLDGLGSGSIVELTTQYVRIWDLDPGIYKWTYSGTKYIYYSGSTSTSYLSTDATTSGVVTLVVTKKNASYKTWYLFDGSSYAAGKLLYGYTSSSSGTYGAFPLPAEVHPSYPAVPVTTSAGYAFWSKLNYAKQLYSTESISTGSKSISGYFSNYQFILAVYGASSWRDFRLLPYSEFCKHTSTSNYMSCGHDNYYVDIYYTSISTFYLKAKNGCTMLELYGIMPIDTD